MDQFKTTHETGAPSVARSPNEVHEIDSPAPDPTYALMHLGAASLTHPQAVPATQVEPSGQPAHVDQYADRSQP